MVQRTTFLGEVVGDEYIVNTASIQQPLLLIFLEDKKGLIDRVASLSSCCYYPSLQCLGKAIYTYNMVTYVPIEMLSSFVDSIVSIDKEVLVIGFNGEICSVPNNFFKLYFKDKSDDFVFEYLKVLLGC